MDDNPISPERLRAYVDKWLARAKRTERILLWVLHLFAFLFCVLGAQPLSATGWLFTIGWMIGLLIHAAAIWMESPAGERYLRRQLAERGIKELYAEAATSIMLDEPAKEKAKRAALTLTDDGELIPLDEAESDGETHAAHRSEQD